VRRFTARFLAMQHSSRIFVMTEVPSCFRPPRPPRLPKTTALFIGPLLRFRSPRVWLLLVIARPWRCACPSHGPEFRRCSRQVRQPSAAGAAATRAQGCFAAAFLDGRGPPQRRSDARLDSSPHAGDVTRFTTTAAMSRPLHPMGSSTVVFSWRFTIYTRPAHATG
jgi:hypothetical protein